MSPSTPRRWQVVAGTAALLGIWALFKFVTSIRRDRQLADTPLVKIRSAAQGYVKVSGLARCAEDPPTAAPLSSRACVWWSFTVEKRRGRGREEDGWEVVDNASSVTPFVLADADSECLVGPVNAEITPTCRNVWYGDSLRPTSPPPVGNALFVSGNFRYTELLLKVGDALSVTGELRSHSEIDGTDKTGALLRQWKLNQGALLSRFDSNHDGRVDTQEWEAARAAAAAEVRASQLKTPVVRTSVIGEPTHGEPFLIAPMDGARLVRREKWRALAFLALGLVCVLLCGLALERFLGHAHT